ncbi:MAG: hypothetical protein COA78_09615 [Blastopirellula sp.]|nr:MAG: hypothetical protein COA78_09615 [Blastopirellula sp.]
MEVIFHIDRLESRLIQFSIDVMSQREIHSPKRTGFTLVEIMIVVVILSILASVIITQMSESTGDAQDAVLIENLQFVRRQINLYKTYHDGKAPALMADATYGTTLDIEYSTDAGTTKSLFKNSDGSKFATSAFTVMPENPFTHGRAIKTSNDPANETVDKSLTIGGEIVGWFYNPNTGDLAPNAPGSNPSGIVRIRL